MAQFDVYPNPSKQTKSAYPFILDIQHVLIEDLTTRVVVPLAKTKHFSKGEMTGLTPKITFEDEDLLIMIPQIASIPSKTLKEPIGTLVHMRDEIIAALDFAITGI